MIEIVIAVLSSSVISTLLTLAGGFFIVNKKAADYTNELEKQKKVAEIYYQERAKVLQELYVLLVNRSSNLLNLITFLYGAANGGQWSRPQAYTDIYHEVVENEKRLMKVLFNSSLYLNDNDYKTIKKFRDELKEPVKNVIDSFSLYEKIPDLEADDVDTSEEFNNFSTEALREFGDGRLSDKCVDVASDFGKIARIIKKVIASEEVQL